MTGIPKEVQELLDKQACSELVYKMQRGLDRMDADLIRSVFHPDGVIDLGGFKGNIDEFIKWVMGVLPTMKRTHHHIGNQLIEVNGDTAHCESYLIATHDMTKDGKDWTYVLCARYLDRFERRNGVWKNAHRKLVSDCIAEGPSLDAAARAGSPRTWGTRDKSDPSYRS